MQDREYNWEGLTEMTNKYWEEEEPKVFRTSGSELRYYAKAGKLQVYQRKEGTAYGVTKGVVISLGSETEEDLAHLIAFISECVDDHLNGGAYDGTA